MNSPDRASQHLTPSGLVSTWAPVMGLALALGICVCPTPRARAGFVMGDLEPLPRFAFLFFSFLFFSLSFLWPFLFLFFGISSVLLTVCPQVPFSLPCLPCVRLTRLATKRTSCPTLVCHRLSLIRRSPSFALFLVFVRLVSLFSRPCADALSPLSPRCTVDLAAAAARCRSSPWVRVGFSFSFLASSTQG
jgi:hypothetical protein